MLPMAKNVCLVNHLNWVVLATTAVFYFFIVGKRNIVWFRRILTAVLNFKYREITSAFHFDGTQSNKKDAVYSIYCGRNYILVLLDRNEMKRQL
jgi:hypothetical protein